MPSGCQLVLHPCGSDKTVLSLVWSRWCQGADEPVKYQTREFAQGGSFADVGAQAVLLGSSWNPCWWLLSELGEACYVGKLVQGTGVNVSNFGWTEDFWPAQLWALAAGRRQLWADSSSMHPGEYSQQWESRSSAGCATASAYKLQAKSCLICRKKASCPISFSWLLGQSVLQRCCKSSRQVVFSFPPPPPNLLIYTNTYMSSVFRLK